MSFHGLFIGIDRCASRNIQWLGCAQRDAKALHALFTDTLGGDTRLLTEAQATRAAIKAEFEHLASCQPEDTVVITFSGHGSETHELVTYDADTSRLAETCIPLDELTEWFGRIPARRLVLVLDCCFSGSAGAKVLHVDATTRSLHSVESKLNEMVGEGRLILTASSATEEALELQSLQHGVLTYFLMEALQGAEEVRENGKVSIYRLLNFVTTQVISATAQRGHVQTPTLRGSLDGDLTWPIFVPGETFKSAFPQRSLQPVTSDLTSLKAHGFPDELIAAWAENIPGLNPLQLDAINEFGLLRGEHLLVSAPTSSGKTMIGELAALRGVINRQRAFFLLPLKALVSDKHRHFQQVYGSYGIRTIRATGDSSDDIPDLMRGQYDICLMTYEKFAGLVLANPYLLNQVGTVVVDEVQMITDESRGANLEFILTVLRMRRQQGVEPQLIALSAVIGDTGGMENWLGGRLLRREERPVPLDEGILDANGTFRYIHSETGEEQTAPAIINPVYGKGSSQDLIKPLVKKLVNEGKQVIVFRETKGEVRGTANYLSDLLGLPAATDALAQLPTGDPSQASSELRKVLSGGVAFHIADLDREERLVVEEHFRIPKSPIRVIVATTTLAMGVNTPAEAVVVAGLMHPQEKPYTVAEYKNIIGRAGRLGMAERGTSYLIAMTPHDVDRYWRHYVQAKPEDIKSRFLDEKTDPATLIVRVLAAIRKPRGAGMTEDEIIDFLESSFGAYQMARTHGTWSWNRQTFMGNIAALAQNDLIRANEEGAYHLTPLGRLAGEGGIEVRSVLRLVQMLRQIPIAAITDPTLIAATQATYELDEVYFPINKKSYQPHHAEPQAWMGELSRMGVAPRVAQSLWLDQTEPQTPVLRAKRAASCLYWMSQMTMSQIEATVTQFSGRGEAAGPIRSVASRTYDLLPTVIKVADLLHPEANFSGRTQSLLARLEAGVSSKAAELAQLCGTRLTRGDYQNLLQMNLVSIEILEQVDEKELLAALGGSPAKVALIQDALEKNKARKEQSQLLPADLPLYED